MILVTADLHLNANPRDEYRHEFMADTLPALIQKYKVDCLIVLGDCTDDKDFHSAKLVNRVVGHFQALAALCKVIVKRGNHDYTDPDHPFFAFLTELPGVYWVNRVMTGSDFPVEFRAVINKNWLFLPHTANWKRDWSGKLWDAAGPLKHPIIFSHQTYQGAKVGPRQMEGIPTSIFPDNARVISGDIHVPQTFDVITYVGAPYTCNFGDDFKPRVLLIDTDGAGEFGSVTSVPVPGRQKRLLEINSLSDLKQSGMVSNGDIVKVRMNIKASDHARWPELQSKIREWGRARGVVIHVVQPQVINQKGKATARRRESTRTDQELVELYGEARAVSPQTLKVGLEMMRKA